MKVKDVPQVGKLGLTVTWPGAMLYAALIVCGLVIHYSLFLLVASSTFWIVKTEGIEGSYFTFAEFGRLPREAYRHIASTTVFVYLLPAVIVSNTPANALLGRLDWTHVVWLIGLTALWFALAVTVFHRGLRRYTSASS
jgi:ABC-2 type transport system permease protein